MGSQGTRVEGAALVLGSDDGATRAGALEAVTSGGDEGVFWSQEISFHRCWVAGRPNFGSCT